MYIYIYVDGGFKKWFYPEIIPVPSHFPLFEHQNRIWLQKAPGTQDHSHPSGGARCNAGHWIGQELVVDGNGTELVLDHREPRSISEHLGASPRRTGGDDKHGECRGDGKVYGVDIIIYIYMYIYIYIYVDIYICIYIYIQYVYIYTICIYIYMIMYVYMNYVYIYIYIKYIYIYKSNMYIYIYV